MQFFPEQHQHKPTKTFVPGQHARIQDFFCQGGGGGGGAVQAPQLILQFTEGVQLFYYTFSRGSNFFEGGGVRMLIFIETHITITCDFPGGSGPPITLWISMWTMWHFCKIGSDELVRPPFKVRNYKCYSVSCF